MPPRVHMVPCGTQSVPSNLFPVRYALSIYLLLKRKTSVVNYKESAWLKPAGRQTLTPSYRLQGKDEIIVSRSAVLNLWAKSSKDPFTGVI